MASQLKNEEECYAKAWRPIRKWESAPCADTIDGTSYGIGSQSAKLMLNATWPDELADKIIGLG